MLILFMLVYIWAILCMQLIANAAVEHTDGLLPHHEELQYYFGSVSRSMLTMFECIVGGIGWDVIAEPLAEDISPLMTLLIIVYIIITCYAVTNMMTGMFVQRAMLFTFEDQDRSLANRIRDISFRPDANGVVHDISWEQFEEMLK